MAHLNVDLGDRSYPIFIETGLLYDSEKFLPYIKGEKVLIVSNETVAPLLSEQLINTLNNHKIIDQVVLPDGEQYKGLETLNLIFDALLEKKHNRRTTLIALGGGVIGDMTGFAAACYQRGVNFIQVPTTLLSQVDSSVGGKTGVNHPLGKNMIGAFYQPQSVVIDIDVLDSLPERELSAGLAEVIKYGLIYDSSFFDWIENNIEKLLNKDAEALIYAIETSCLIKAKVVAEDEKENGIRAILNLGHTFGHAIEAYQGYGSWLHGEAVGAGMVMACDLSVRMGWIDMELYDRAVTLIGKARLPVKAPENMSESIFLDYMSVDKKNIDNAIRLVLLKACGKAIVTTEYSKTLLSETLTGVPLR